MSQEKCRVAREGLVKKLHRFKKIISQARGVNLAVVDEFFCSQEEVVGSQVRGGTLADRTLFLLRELGLKLVGDGFGHLTLNREDVGQSSVVGIGPQMGIIGCFDQLYV